MGLKGIPTLISPDLLKILAEMGHGDTIVLADAFFPGESIAAKNGLKVVRADGVRSITDLLKATLHLMDLDPYMDKPVTLMDLVDSDKKKKMPTPENWLHYARCIEHASGLANCSQSIEYAERFEFYEKAKTAYAIVMTGDSSPYGNIILAKGVTRGIELEA